MRLLAGESMVLPPIRKHWIVLAGRLFWPVLIAVALLALVAFLSAPAASGIRVILTLLALCVPAVALCVAWITWRASTITVTDQRVILQRGVLDRTSTVIPLNRVQDVTTRQNLIGRILDFGSVEIDTAGAVPTELFTYAAHPETLRDQVFVLIDRFSRSV
jgi:uncharacterized membrane protein YdbT with pleckstrin-like domain